MYQIKNLNNKPELNKFVQFIKLSKTWRMFCIEMRKI